MAGKHKKKSKKYKNKKLEENFNDYINGKFEDFSFNDIMEENEIEEYEYKLNKSYDFINLQNSKKIKSKGTKTDTNIIINNKNNNKNKDLNEIQNIPIKIKNEFKDQMIIIKYSNKQRKIPTKLIFQYNYDTFKKDDYDKAFIILFFSDNYEIKRKTINSFFNIIKGKKLETNERYILIENKIFNNQTDIGLHIYYLKDYDNKPIILIDCIGYGYSKNIEQDGKIMEAFSYLFQNLIKHINLVSFIIKESCERLSLFKHYGIGCVTSLFSENILNNFIYLVTNIETYNIKQRPQISFTLLNDIYYDYIKYKMDKKWFYAINNESLFNKEINELSKYSYEQLIELYKEKILNSKKVIIKESLDIIKSRLTIKSKIDLIVTNFKTLKNENDKIINFDSYINTYDQQIRNIDNKINNKNIEIYNLNTQENYYNKELSDLERAYNSKIYDLENQYETVAKRELEYTSYSVHTICKYCEKNCHNYCSCFGGFVNRCEVFPIFGNDCESCGHDKSWHRLHQHEHYVYKNEKRKISNYEKIMEENDKYYKKVDEINNNKYEKINQKNRIEGEIRNLNREKNDLLSSKNYYINEKNKIYNNMKPLNKDISKNISILIDISNKISDEALNKYQFEIENDYIDYLINEIKKSNKNKNEIEKLNKKKETNILYKELSSNYIYLFGFKYVSTY